MTTIILLIILIIWRFNFLIFDPKGCIKNSNGKCQEIISLNHVNNYYDYDEQMITPQKLSSSSIENSENDKKLTAELLITTKSVSSTKDTFNSEIVTTTESFYATAINFQSNEKKNVLCQYTQISNV
ncbi:hypothetical protein PVAND_014573 [Polypedilum vanderplanki]|uniref:Uncharacterized protein n=1 Tax=Polypedilum vanderplanki TaxID=319348 RepID=A0A9J6BAL2_POLVA|nr:hypothetical protein PVAND_014573 [Polypedilum vanderplanki]